MEKISHIAMGSSIRTWQCLAVFLGLCFSAVASVEARYEPPSEISEEEGQQAPLAGYENGRFFLRSADGRFELTPRIVVQLQHRAQIIEAAPDTNDIFLRRGRLVLKGHLFTPDFSYKLQFGFGTPEPEKPQFDLKDLYLSYRFKDLLRIKGGQFKVPFGLQEMTSGRKLQFVERSLANNEFTPGRDIGLILMGSSPEAFWEYAVGAFNGDGKNSFNTNKNFLYALRVGVNPLGQYEWEESDLKGDHDPRFTVGANFFQNKDATAGDNLFVFGGYAGLKWAGLSFRGEYFHRLNKDDQSISAKDRDAQGYYAQVGYFLVPAKFEFGFRGSQVFRKGADNNEEEYSAVLNYFFKGQKVKLQLDYALGIDQNAIAGTNDEVSHTIRTQFQLAL